MRLSEIVHGCDDLMNVSEKDPDITMICTDSRLAREGALFIAIQGYKEDGKKYIEDAVRKGARAVVVENGSRSQIKVSDSVPVCLTNNARKCALKISRVFYKYPSRAFHLIGITGTNGKTTVSYLMEAILREKNQNPGVIGTISYRYNDTVRKAKNTTPDPIEIQSLFSEMQTGGVTHAIMEVSSHALAMDRVEPSDYDLAVFTNLSQDHLDFHDTMEEYFKAKATLFRDLNKNACAIINNDDEYGRKLKTLTRGRIFTYGLHTDSDYRARVTSLSIEGTAFTLNGEEFEINLVGEHNVYNVVTAYAAVKVFNIEDGVIREALRKVKNIPGRFERVGEERDFHVFVDYAHTPDALDHLLDAANSLKTGRIITVFGCGGDRDRKKRPIMGGIVEGKSDIAIVTSDNPRTEDPLSIIAGIKKGLKAHNHIIIPDRRRAIYRAIELAEKNDIVLIAGKGHEDYQILGDKTIHFDDREIALEAMRYTAK